MRAGAVPSPSAAKYGAASGRSTDALRGCSGDSCAMSERAEGPTIVVGYDGSDPSRSALRRAARRALPDGLVVVVHAYDLPPDLLGSPDYGGLLASRQAHGRALLEALPMEGADELLDVEYETELIGGHPAEAIVNVARVRDADEIVIGARGHGRVRALLGSVSLDVLHHADRPVTVIPAAGA